MNGLKKIARWILCKNDLKNNTVSNFYCVYKVEKMNKTDDFDISVKPPFKSKKLRLSGVSVSSPKIHLVDVDGDVIESLNIMSHAEKLRDAINTDPESIAHHYQVMIRDER